MKQIGLLFFIITLVIAGCAQSEPEKDRMEKSQPPSDIVSDKVQDKKIDDREFVLDINPDPQGPVLRTVASHRYNPESAYYEYKTTKLKVSDCLAMEEGYYKNRRESNCLTEAAVYLKDINVCENLKTDEYKTFCYGKYAINTADPKGCELIDKLDNNNLQPGYTESCKRQVALLTGDASLCVKNEIIPDEDSRVSLCKEIADSKVLVGREECREEIVPYILTESTYFGEAINWLRKEHTNEKVLSWWDYGAAMDCVGLKSVISNKDLDDPKILEVAYLFTQGNESELIEFMKHQDSDYMLFDVEAAGSGIGGKYHALSYLGCAWTNKTSVGFDPGSSKCEAEHMWEIIHVPLETPEYQCTISESSNKKGVTAFYKLKRDTSGYIIGLDSPIYCLGKTTLANGQEVVATYYLDRKYENGDLKLNKAILLDTGTMDYQSRHPPINSFVLLYTKDPIWVEDGEIKNGYEDRKGKYYDSNIYRAFFLKELPGFELVYESPQRSQFGGHVKIYKLN